MFSKCKKYINKEISRLFNKKLETAIFFLVSSFLIVGVLRGLLPWGLTEVLGFVTGAACVWLIVKEDIWNWPIGLANNLFFIILFLQARLFADTALQVVYIVLGILGWYWWLHGGENKSELEVSRVDKKTIVTLSLITVIATLGMTKFLTNINDSAPFWDALTTVLSLVAQYLLTKKFIENWFVWITADLIYIWLYIYKGLALTGGLYFIFLCMCIKGYLMWRRSLSVKADKGL